jgi:hypothetical protein
MELRPIAAVEFLSDAPSTLDRFVNPTTCPDDFKALLVGSSRPMLVPCRVKTAREAGERLGGFERTQMANIEQVRCADYMHASYIISPS